LAGQGGSAGTPALETVSPLHGSEARPGSLADEAKLEFPNGHGGFADDGREYVTVIRDGVLPPMPWLNVVANPDFGFTTTEAGGGYAWSQNSQRNPITPWANDPVSDPPQEVLYRSEERRVGNRRSCGAWPCCGEGRGRPARI